MSLNPVLRSLILSTAYLAVLHEAGNRLHAQSPTLLRLRNASSADRLVVDSAGGLLLNGSYPRGAIPASGVGARMMWYPKKAAFRAGFSTGTTWDDPSIGTFSFAGNIDTEASGYAAAAFGEDTHATGHASFGAGEGANATGLYAVAVGFGATASGESSFAASGVFATASGDYSVALGAYATASSQYAFAAGRRLNAGGLGSSLLGEYATSTHDGNFMFGDASTTTPITSAAANQFSIRAAGGVRLFTNSGLTSGVTLAAGGSAWNVVSDRRRKDAFLAIDGEDVLARIRTLPLSSWRYIAEADRSTRHIGPMAQDWHAAFGFSRDSLTINSGDLDGVNLAGVQALEARTRAQAERIQILETRNAAQNDALSDANERIRRLEAALEEVRRQLRGSARP